MQTRTIIELEAASEPLRLFTFFGDYQAGLRAAKLKEFITRTPGLRWTQGGGMRQLGWENPIGPLRELLASEAASADVLLAAITPLDEAMRWLRRLADWQANRAAPGLLIGLFGDEDQQLTPSGRVALNQCALSAQRRGLEFVWRSMNRGALNDSSWVTTPLRELMAGKRATIDCSASWPLQISGDFESALVSVQRAEAAIQ